MNPGSLTTHPLLHFDITVDSNGEIKKRIAGYRDLKVKIIEEKFININGSVHKYFNNGFHNYNDFTVSDFLMVCADLSKKFNLNPYSTALHNVEFGVNVLLPFNTREVLNAIISYKGKEYEQETFSGKGYLIRFPFDHYDLKIYDKGHQYELGKNVFRFEIKVKKMEYFKKRGIEILHLSDLFDSLQYGKLKECLLKAITELVIYDPTIELEDLPPREKTVLLNGKNPKYWTALKQQGIDIKKKRNRFNELVLKHGKQNTKAVIYDLIENKWDELSSIDTSTAVNVLSYLSQFDPKTFPEITTFENTNSQINQPRINSSNKELITGTTIIKCLSCGRNITNQKKGSMFCSEKIYGKEAKKCRNMQSNPKNNYLRKETRLYSGGVLFDVNQCRI